MSPAVSPAPKTKSSLLSRLDGGRLLLLIASLLVLSALGAAYPLSHFGEEWLSVTWQQPLWLFFLIPLPWVLWRATYGHDRRSVRVKLGTVSAFHAGPRGIRARLRDIPGAARTVGLAFCILALARPVSVLRPSVAEEQGIDLVVALDLSGSMQAVMENLPQDLGRYVQKEPGVPPDRLDAAKAVLRDFIARRESDRIGVVVFGKTAYVVSPPTLDYQLLDTLVARMEHGSIDGSATAIGEALGVAVARLRRSHAKSKGIVLLTDGDNKGGKVSPEYAAELANKHAVKVYTVQIGSGDSARVFAGFNFFGQPTFKEIGMSTNPELLKKLAESTGASTFVAKDAKNLQETFHKVLNDLEKTEFEAAQASYEDLFRWLLLPGVLLIFFEALLVATWLRRFP